MGSETLPNGKTVRMPQITISGEEPDGAKFGTYSYKWGDTSEAVRSAENFIIERYEVCRSKANFASDMIRDELLRTAHSIQADMPLLDYGHLYVHLVVCNDPMLTNAETVNAYNEMLTFMKEVDRKNQRAAERWEHALNNANQMSTAARASTSPIQQLAMFDGPAVRLHHASVVLMYLYRLLRLCEARQIEHMDACVVGHALTNSAPGQQLDIILRKK